METTTAALTVAALTPYLVKLGEKAAEKVGERLAQEGLEQPAKIWHLVKGLFRDDDITALNLFAATPEDPKTQGRLEGKLEERLATNPDVSKQLKTLLAELPKHNDVVLNNIDITGDDNIGKQRYFW